MSAQRVLVVAAEVPDDRLAIHRQVHRALVERQVFVAGHDLRRDAPAGRLYNYKKCNRVANRGLRPLHPQNAQMIQMTQASIGVRIHATTGTPDEVVVRLIVGVHVAIVEVHVPRVRGIIGIRRRRPIVGRLDNCLPTLAESKREPETSPSEPNLTGS